MIKCVFSENVSGYFGEGRCVDKKGREWWRGGGVWCTEEHDGRELFSQVEEQRTEDKEQVYRSLWIQLEAKWVYGTSVRMLVRHLDS